MSRYGDARPAGDRAGVGSGGSVGGPRAELLRAAGFRGLGNAVVPQVAEHVGRLIMTAAAGQIG